MVRRRDNLRAQEVGPAGVSGPKGPEEPVQQQHQDGQDKGQLPVPRDGDAGGKVVRLLPELGPQALHSPLQFLSSHLKCLLYLAVVQVVLLRTQCPSSPLSPILLVQKQTANLS